MSHKVDNVRYGSATVFSHLCAIYDTAVTLQDWLGFGSWQGISGNRIVPHGPAASILFPRKPAATRLLCKLLHSGRQGQAIPPLTRCR